MPATVVGGLAVLLLAAAALTWWDGRSPSGGRPAAGPAAAVATTATTTGGQRQARPVVTAGAPRRVRIAALDVDAAVLPVVAQGQSLDPPADPQVLGWWSQGARPGADRGTALVTGHTVHDGGGALDDLEDLPVGASIEVVTDRGPITYRAQSVVVLDKDAIARRAPHLFSQQVDGRLALVTCEGWDGTGYDSNVVVTATPVR